jgi:hypothetical protein
VQPVSGALEVQLFRHREKVREKVLEAGEVDLHRAA